MILWLAPVLLPLIGSLVALLLAPRWRQWLVVLAPLPALVLAVAGAPGEPPDLSWVLLDVRLALDAVGQVLLALTAIVWLAAGASARRLTASSPGFTALWLLTLAGNVGLVLAADAVSFYALYATMTFAAYGLIVHERTPAALRAGRITIVLAVIGEALLISGLMLAVGVAGSTELVVVAAALGDAPVGIAGLLAAGFAVKAGVVPLHVWLPLAHPEAPIPASAALSGAMIKAGLVGWLRLLPLGQPDDGLAAAMIAFGLLTAFVGAAIGVMQVRAKVVLAYSSVSQMGLITVLVGLGLTMPEHAEVALAAAVVYALHHALAKAALFLGVGVLSGVGAGRARGWVLGGLALAGASLAGAPLTSGYVAKVLTKPAVGALGDPWAGRLGVALSLAAVGTTLLMVRFGMVLVRTHPPGPRGVERAAVGAWAGLVSLVVLAVWFAPTVVGLTRPTPSLSSSIEAAWPVLLGGGIAVAAWTLARHRAPMRRRIPPGDLVVIAEAVLPRIAGRLGGARRPVDATRLRVRAVGATIQRSVQPGQGFTRLDERLTRWRTAGVLFVVLIAVLAWALVIPAG